MTAPAQTVPFLDLAPQHGAIAESAKAAIARLIAAGSFVLGEEVTAFEREFAEYCGAGHCVGVASGTDAIELALRAVGACEGTEVITVPHTFVATVEAVAATGARPVLVDVNPATRCIDPAQVTGALTARTAAVLPVHLYGRPAPMDELERACAGSGTAIVEDSAQAHGALLHGRRLGAWGSAGAFSFYPSKNLGAMGDGGAVVTDDPELAGAIRSLRHHGSAPGDPNRHLRPGTTSRLDELQAAMLRLKLERLTGWTHQRRELADAYRRRLAGLPLTLPPPDPPGGEQVYHLFVIEVDERDRVRESLSAQGVGTGVHYPTPVHLQPGWASLGYGPGDLPVSERLAARSLSLPLFPGMSLEQIELVGERLERAIEGV